MRPQIRQIKVSSREERGETPKMKSVEGKTDKEISPKAKLRSKKKQYFPSSDGAVLA